MCVLGDGVEWGRGASFLDKPLSASQSGQQQGRDSHRNAETWPNAGLGLRAEWPALGQASVRNPKYDQTPSLGLNRAPGHGPQVSMRVFLEQYSPMQGRAGLNFGEEHTRPEWRWTGLQGGCDQCYVETCTASPPLASTTIIQTLGLQASRE